MFMISLIAIAFVSLFIAGKIFNFVTDKNQNKTKKYIIRIVGVFVIGYMLFLLIQNEEHYEQETGIKFIEIDGKYIPDDAVNN